MKRVFASLLVISLSAFAMEDAHKAVEKFKKMQVQNLNSPLMCDLLKMAIKYSVVYYDELDIDDVSTHKVLERSQQEIAMQIKNKLRVHGSAEIIKEVSLALDHDYEIRKKNCPNLNYHIDIVKSVSISWLIDMNEHFDELRLMALIDDRAMPVSQSFMDSVGRLQRQSK